MTQVYNFIKGVLFWTGLIVVGLILAIVFHKDNHSGGGH